MTQLILDKQCMFMLTMTNVISGIISCFNHYLVLSLQVQHLTQKKDHFTQLANVVMPEKPHQTGNLRNVLQLKVGASIMVTNNIDVNDGLTNGARGTVTNIITDQNQQKIQAILVQFDNQAIGEDAKKKSKYKHINKDAVPIVQSEVSFPVKGASSFNVTRRQFPLMPAWAVTSHKCRGLTLAKIVVDMSPEKGTYQPGQAYVAFSRVR